VQGVVGAFPKRADQLRQARQTAVKEEQERLIAQQREQMRKGGLPPKAVPAPR
jgi:hypothetical protein